MKSLKWLVPVLLAASFGRANTAKADDAKWHKTAPRIRGTEFHLDVQVPSTYKVQSAVNSSPVNKEIEAFAELKWMDPPAEAPNTTNQEAWLRFKRLMSTLFPGEQLELDAALPYYGGSADLSVTARRWTPTDDGPEIFNPQLYKWTPASSVDPFAEPMPGSDVLWLYTYFSLHRDTLNLIPYPSAPVHGAQRSYDWTFGAMKRDPNNPKALQLEDFPQVQTVNIDVTPEEGLTGKLTAQAKISWYPADWETQTGFQNTLQVCEQQRVTRSNGQIVFVTELNVDEAIMCRVRGEVGEMLDRNRHLTAQPLIEGENRPLEPGERTEARQIIHIYEHEGGCRTLVLNAIPSLDPEHDPNAPGYDEIQQTKQIEAAYQQTVQTGKVALKSTLEIYVALFEQISVGRVQGWGVEGAIKGVIAAGRLLEEAAAAGRLAQKYEKIAGDLRTVSDKLRDLIRRGLIPSGKLAQYQKRLAEQEMMLARAQQAARDLRSAQTRGQQMSGRMINARPISPNDLLRQNANNEVPIEKHDEIRQVFAQLGGDPAMLRFNQGSKTGYLDPDGLGGGHVINIRGDVFPRPDGGSVTARLDVKLVLAHELGHSNTAATSAFAPNTWQDELIAARWAVYNAQGLTKDEKILLLEDALEKARLQNAVPEFFDNLTEAEKAMLYGY